MDSQLEKTSQNLYILSVPIAPAKVYAAVMCKAFGERSAIRDPR
jgi:hypothetical protein